MITIISGTNRKGSNTRKVSEVYVDFLKQHGKEHQLFSLEDIPRDLAFTYLVNDQTNEVKEMLDNYFSKSERFIFVVPEYNGTFPGVFKLVLDAVPPRLLARKKVLLVGVANGRAGNLRGLDQLTNALHYLGMNIYPKHLPISRFNEMVNEKGEFVNEDALKSIRVQLDGFLEF